MNTVDGLLQKRAELKAIGIQHYRVKSSLFRNLHPCAC